MRSKQININTNIDRIDSSIGTSAVPKKLQRKPLTKYKTGLNREINCQVLGNIVTL